MAATRRVFTTLAREFKIVRPDPGTPDYGVWADMVQCVSRTMKAENGNFDKDRFHEACGLIR